jgi:hypothetical protein
MLLAATAGCGGTSDLVVSKHASHVRKLTSLYALASSTLKHAPRDEPEFKQALATLQVAPEKYEVGSIDELFTSERDGQPLVVVYGAARKGSDIVVYEQSGVDGTRLVGHRIGKIEELDEAAFSSLGLAIVK